MNIGRFKISLHVRHPQLSAEQMIDAFDFVPKFNQTVGQPSASTDQSSLAGSHVESYCNFPIKNGSVEHIGLALDEIATHLNDRKKQIATLVESGAKIRCAIAIFECDGYGFDISPNIEQCFAQFMITVSLYVYS
jgi:hypothetical protein